MFVPLLAVPIALQLVAGGVPTFNVTQSCRGAAEANYISPSNERQKLCLESEQRTRDKLAKDWSTFPAADRANCVATMKGFAPTYTELATCLEMKRDLKTTKPADVTAPKKP